MRDENDISQILNTLRNNNPSNINCCYLNINSVRNKFSDLQEVINGNVDIASIMETKIGASFPSAQFVLDEHHLPLLHGCVTERKGGILVYLKSLILSHRLNCGNLCDSIQAIPFEINPGKEKWLVISVYRPPIQDREYFLNSLTKLILCDNNI